MSRISKRQRHIVIFHWYGLAVIRNQKWKKQDSKAEET